MTTPVEKLVSLIHEMNVADMPQKTQPKDSDMCVVCKTRKATTMHYVCLYGRCGQCFEMGSKIYCPKCKPLKYYAELGKKLKEEGKTINSIYQ